MALGPRDRNPLVHPMAGAQSAATNRPIGPPRSTSPGAGPCIEEVYRRQVFGLFQEDIPTGSQRIHDLAAKYEHIRNTLHGVLFLFKEPGTGILAYNLEQYLVWNPVLIDEARARPIYTDVASAIPPRLI